MSRVGWAATFAPALVRIIIRNLLLQHQDDEKDAHPHTHGCGGYPEGEILRHCLLPAHSSGYIAQAGGDRCPGPDIYGFDLPINRSVQPNSIPSLRFSRVDPSKKNHFDLVCAPLRRRMSAVRGFPSSAQSCRAREGRSCTPSTDLRGEGPRGQVAWGQWHAGVSENTGPYPWSRESASSGPKT